MLRRFCTVWDSLSAINHQNQTVVSGECPEIEVANTPNDLKRTKTTDLAFALQTTFAEAKQPLKSPKKKKLHNVEK